MSTPTASAWPPRAFTASAWGAATRSRSGCPTGRSSTSRTRRPCSSPPPRSRSRPTFTAEQAEHVIGDAGSRALVSEPAYLEHAFAVGERGSTALKLIILVEGAHTNVLTWDELLAGAPEGFDVAAAAGDCPRTTSRRSSARRGRPARRTVPRARRGARARGTAARDLLAAVGPHRRAAVHALPRHAPRLDGDVPRERRARHRKLARVEQIKRSPCCPSTGCPAARS